MSSFRHWLLQRVPLTQYWSSLIGDYQVPKALNLGYVFGGLLLFVLFNQAFTGFWLMMFYTPSVDVAFDSIQLLMREVSYGWLFRYMHAIGASVLFFLLYLHLFRNLLYGSYRKPRELVWLLGMLLLVILMFEAFLGYTLPWGQTSYWGAQILLSVIETIPFIGQVLANLFRGDFILSDMTLHRFYALHVFAMPILIFFIVYLHIVALRHVGSSTPVVYQHHVPKISFYPFFVLKDLVALCFVLTGCGIILFYNPEGSGYIIDPLNSVKADPLITPEHIHPAWYLSFFYTILRLFSNKSFGLWMIILCFFLWFGLPWMDRNPYRVWSERPMMQKILFIVSILSFIVLSGLAFCEWSQVLIVLGRVCCLGYFLYFIRLSYVRH